LQFSKTIKNDKGRWTEPCKEVEQKEIEGSQSRESDPRDKYQKLIGLSWRVKSKNFRLRFLFLVNILNRKKNFTNLDF